MRSAKDSIDRVQLADLASKYAEMLRMRQASGEVSPSDAMARLASAFPGALRELDDFPLDVLEARRAAVVRASTGDGPVEPWMIACVTFHRLARGALSAKRWLGGKKEVSPNLEAEFAAAAERLPFPDDARLWQTHLGVLANPPHGRLSRLVFERVGLAMAISATEARMLVFGPSRRERKAPRRLS